MSNIKRYQITSDDDYHQVCLRVDHDVLTPAVAAEINNFWGGSKDRLADQGFDVVETVIRLFGSLLFQLMLADGGCEFASDDEDEKRAFTKRVLELAIEGWPPYEELGITVSSADVYLPEFNGVTLQRIADVEFKS